MNAPLGILLSGSGSTYANLVEHIEAGLLPASIAVVIASRADCAGCERARAWGHPLVISHDQDEIQSTLQAHGCQWVAMCGFMRRFDPRAALRGRVVNVHPSLLPAFGGQGYYGDRVHRAVIAHGAKVSGCSVHLVAGDYDSGPLLAQRPVPVLASDTVESLRQRVQAAERHLYPLVLRALISDPEHFPRHGSLAAVDGGDDWDLGFDLATDGKHGHFSVGG